MMLRRSVPPEALDSLPFFDPAALAARRDLRTLHRVMGTRHILQQALHRLRPPATDRHTGTPRSTRPWRVLELGAGDGRLLLELASQLGMVWNATQLTLLDRQPLVSAATRRAYHQIGWNVVPQVVDVLEWAQEQTRPRRLHAPQWDLVLANLFMHHFETPVLQKLLASIACNTRHLLVCEPRRAPLVWVGSQLLGLLGVHSVTRKDAVLSVRAGFRGQELSALWPQGGAAWQLHEYPAGLFSHCFMARRIGFTA